MTTRNDDKLYSDTTKSGGKEGLGFISQRDKNRRRFRRGDMHSTGGNRRSRLSSHSYNLRSPINIYSRRRAKDVFYPAAH